MRVANVSVTIILISAAASIGIFKQSYEIIFWTVLLAWGSLNGGGFDFISRNAVGVPDIRFFIFLIYILYNSLRNLARSFFNHCIYIRFFIYLIYILYNKLLN